MLDQTPNTIREPSEHRDQTKQLLDECAEYLKQNQTKPNYILAFMGLLVCILSLLSDQRLNLFAIGLLILLWASYLKPQFFSRSSPNFLFFWLHSRSLNHSVNIGKQIDFTLKLARSLDGYCSPFRFLNGRFYLAQKVLSDYFLLQFKPNELIRRSEEGKHKDYITTALNAVILLNTLMAVAQMEDEESDLFWPQDYQKPLQQLIKSQRPIAVASLLSHYYPLLFQK